MVGHLDLGAALHRLGRRQGRPAGAAMGELCGHELQLRQRSSATRSFGFLADALRAQAGHASCSSSMALGADPGPVPVDAGSCRCCWSLPSINAIFSASDNIRGCRSGCRSCFPTRMRATAHGIRVQRAALHRVSRAAARRSADRVRSAASARRRRPSPRSTSLGLVGGAVPCRKHEASRCRRERHLSNVKETI